MSTKEKTWCVYIHRNKINNKVYIGVAKEPAKNRWRNGSGYSKNQSVFYNAIQKYGWDNFEHIIWADKLSQKEAQEWEIRLIAVFKTNCRKYNNPELGYNMTDGGEGASGRGHWVGKNNPKYGSNHWAGKNNPNYGSRKFVGKNNPRARSVVQLSKSGEFIRYWSYISEAAIFLNCSMDNIVSCCAYRIPSAYGFLWMYSEEYEKYKDLSCSDLVKLWKSRDCSDEKHNNKPKKVIRLCDKVIYNTVTLSAKENNMCRATMIGKCKKHDEFMYYNEWVELQTKENEYEENYLYNDQI